MRPETRHSLVLVGGSGLTALLSIVYVLAGPMLGPERYAEFAAATAFIFLCCSAMGPINETVARFSAQYSARGEIGKVRTLVRAVSKRVWTIGLLAGLVGVVLMRPLGAFLDLQHVSLLVAYATIYVTLFVAVARGALRGTQRFGAFNTNIVLEASVRLFAGILLLNAVGGSTAGVSAYLIGAAIVAFLAQFQLRGLWHGIEPQPVDAAALKRFVLPVLVYSLCKAGFEHLDMLLVKRFLDDNQAGLYGAAISLTRGVGAVATPFGVVLLPMLSALHEQGRSIMGAFSRICLYFLLLMLGPLLIVAIWPREIIVLLFGDAFVEAAPLLFPLIVGRTAVYLAAMGCLFSLSTDRYRFLYIYVAGLAAEAAVLSLWHDSLFTVVRGVCLVQGLTLGILALFVMRPNGHGPYRSTGPIRSVSSEGSSGS